ncbi:MAG: sigma-54 dependent transcriptional regulator [Nitrospirota bacterium]|jgi:two-component system response regulator AtoC
MKNNAHRILIVDDERDICRALEFLLSREGYEVESAESGEEAMEKVRKKDFELVMTDLKMEGMDGIELLERVKDISPGAIVILMTAYATVENAVDAMKKGADDYITKPFNNDEVKHRIRKSLNGRRLEMENQVLWRERSNRLRSNKFLGDSPQVREIFDLVEKVVSTKSNILIFGESGTGKGLLAEIIHQNSPRGGKPFMAINCSAIPETLLESELFGYRKGAFTGATADKPGLLEAADGGTVFLDEIGDMPLALQSKLLHVLETGEVLPLGDTRPRTVDVRIVAATHKNLDEAIKGGEFREDLYYRLNVIEVTIPPLRERKEDIILVASTFLERFAEEHGKRLDGIDEAAMQTILEYPWFGNVRELRNAMERAVVLSTGEKIYVEDLPEKVRTYQAAHAAGLKDALNYYERKLILERLAHHDWNKDETARELGIDLATLYRKMKKLGINVEKGS